MLFVGSTIPRNNVNSEVQNFTIQWIKRECEIRAQLKSKVIKQEIGFLV